MNNLEQLILDLKDSVERELAGLRLAMEEGFRNINARFDAQAARLDRQDDLLRTRSPWRESPRNNSD